MDGDERQWMAMDDRDCDVNAPPPTAGGVGGAVAQAVGAPTGSALRCGRRAVSQRGTVLIVALLLLLATSFTGFAAMQSSLLQMKMASARELREMTFQSAEAVLALAQTDLYFLSARRGALSTRRGALPAGGALPAAGGVPAAERLPTRQYSFAHDSELRGSATVRPLHSAPAPGYSIRSGSGGTVTHYYELRARATRTDSPISSTHVQGVYVVSPAPP